jgi:serine protease
MRKAQFKSVLGVAVLGLVLAILTAGCGSSSGRSAGPGTGEGIFVSQELGVSAGVAAERVPDQIIVKFKPGTAETNIQSLNRSQGAAVKRVVADAFVVLKAPASRSVDDLVKSYRANPDVEWAEPDYIAHALGAPNDPYFSYQWDLFDYGTASGKSVSNFGAQAPSAWNASTGSNVTVATVDTGVAYENYAGGPSDPLAPYAQAPDLAGTTFVPGYDFVNGDTHPNDDESHGTHVTGTVAQTTNNSYGVAGIAFNAKIMPVKVLDSSGSGSYSNIAAGIRWAVDNGAKIINMSLGGSSGSQALQDAIAHAQAGGVLVVCAAGNKQRPISCQVPLVHRRRGNPVRRCEDLLLQLWE